MTHELTRFEIHGDTAGSRVLVDGVDISHTVRALRVEMSVLAVPLVTVEHFAGSLLAEGTGRVLHYVPSDEDDIDADDTEGKT